MQALSFDKKGDLSALALLYPVTAADLTPGKTLSITGADYIFGLTHGHVEGVGYLYPEAAEKAFVLREFDDRLGCDAG